MLEIIYKKIEDIIPYINNSRKHPEKQVNQVVASMREFGFCNPILIDERGSVIAGHCRLLAAQKERMDKVPCIILAGLTDAQRKAYVIADNNLSLNSEWDLDLLKIEIETLKGLEFDLDILGFDNLDDMMEEEADEVVEDDFAEEPSENPKSKLNDVWILGNHRLICGDSTDNQIINRLMEGKKASMVFTDPPYLMGFMGNVSGDGQKSFNCKHGAIKNDKMSRVDGDTFIGNIFKVIKERVTGGYYVCFYRLGLDYIYRALDKNDLEHKALIIWDKGNHTLSGSDYMSKYEPIVYGVIKEHNFYGDRSNFDIWEIKRTQKNDLHPTMKPLELCAKAIKNSSKQNEIVLDLFGGSGSTLISCEQLRRACYVVELDEKYVDVIVKRYAKLKGCFDNIKLIREGKQHKFSDIFKNEESYE